MFHYSSLIPAEADEGFKIPDKKLCSIGTAAAQNAHKGGAKKDGLSAVAVILTIGRHPSGWQG
jgi:hypothetical protein